MRKANQTSGRKTAKAKNRAALSAQQTIPYVAMHPDGVCKLPGGLYTKTVEYEDINYSVDSSTPLHTLEPKTFPFLLITRMLESRIPVRTSQISLNTTLDELLL